MRELEYALEVRDLVKCYASVTAVDHLTFQVPKGSIFGLLGPNGAGKTTTLESIEGLKQYDSGTITVAGLDPRTDSRRLYRRIGVQLQTSGIPPAMTCREALRFFCSYHHMQPDYTLLERLGLKEKIGAQYASLSVGQKRRLSLALAAAHKPDILFLDEPTAGLDVESRTELHSLIEEFRQEGKTVVLATHDMAEAEKMCDTIAIIIQGRLAVCGTPEQVTSAGDKRTTITVSTLNGSVCRDIPELPRTRMIRADQEYVRYATEDPAAAVTVLLAYIAQQQDELADLRVERPSLEQRFIEIVNTKEQSI